MCWIIVYTYWRYCIYRSIDEFEWVRGFMDWIEDLFSLLVLTSIQPYYCCSKLFWLLPRRTGVIMRVSIVVKLNSRAHIFSFIGKTKGIDLLVVNVNVKSNVNANIILLILACWSIGVSKSHT